MNIGFGQSEINPPLGMPMEGLGQKGGIQSIHDDLFARALWLEHEDRCVVILSLDLLFFERKVTDRLRGAVARVFDLKLNEILLNFTHTHAGPRCSEWHYSGRVDPVYLDKVERGILSAVEQARQDVEPVDVWAGKTTTRLPVSRRWLDDKGIAHWRPNLEAEVCKHLPFALFKTAQGRTKALLFSVSCHPSMIYTNDVSAEWPGAAVHQLNAHFQTTGSVFLQGAAGDTKPRQVAAETRWRPGTWEEMEEAGKEVADAVIAAASGTLEKIQPELRAISLETFWPLMTAPKREELEAEAKNAETQSDRRSWATDMLQRIDLLGKPADQVPMTLHGIQIGRGLRLVALECEMVGELGNVVLREFTEGVTFPLGYTNGCAIYLPSDRQLPQLSYEVVSYWEYHWPAPLAAGIDERLRQGVWKLQQNGIA